MSRNVREGLVKGIGIMWIRSCSALLLACCFSFNALAAGFVETFDSAALDSWNRHTAGGGTIEGKDGWTTFSALPRKQAHLARLADGDLIMVSAWVARWASVYLVWDDQNWCGVGKSSPTPFGRFTSRRIWVHDEKPFGTSGSAPAHFKDATGAIDELRVEPTPQADQTLTVGVPEHAQEIGVDWLGRIDASPWAPPKAWFFVGEKNVPFGEAGMPFKRRLLEGYLPLVTLSRAIAGVCEFQDGIDHAYTFGYLNNALKRNEPRKALLGFWSFLAFGMTRDTYSPVEVSMIKTGENHYTLPHLYSCTEQLRLLRNLLLREDGDVLHIGQGIPRAWLEAGKHVAVTKAPTDFGDVTYRVGSAADGSMKVQLDVPARRPPAEVRICLRHPKRQAIAAVDAPEGVDVSFCGETIVLKNARGALDQKLAHTSR
ncbi:MAG: hypothetical protein ABIP55_12485 [Tepidisphaeraceae bacterium]